MTKPLDGKKVTAIYGLPGSPVLKTVTGKFKEILSFSEALTFLIISSDDTDTLINLDYVISFTVQSPPSDYEHINVSEPGSYIT